MSYLKSYIFITNSFNVKLEDKGNDVFSITFSDNKGSFYSRFPDIIMQSLTETAYNPHKFLKENSWILKLCKEINDFALYYFEIQENDIQYRFNIITYKKHVIHSRLLHTLYDCEQLSIIEYSDDIVVVRDFSESSTFLNHKGEVLLRTDGLTGWDYNKITPFFRTSDKLSPKDIIISSNLVLCKTGEMWISYTRELQKLSEIPQMLNSRAEGIEDWRCNYLLVRMFRESADPRRTSITDLVCRSLVFYKDGSIVFIDDTSVIDTIHKSTLFDDIYYATYFNNQHVAVFKNGKYLYNIIPSISYDLFDKNDSYAVFYDRTVANTRFGVLNRKLEYVVPQVLEFARVAFNKHIIYSLDGKYGVWDENFVNVIPAQYDSIECVEKFYLVAKGGGFPNLFWNNCKGSSFGNLSREPFESFIYRQNGDLAWHYGFNNIYPCFKHFIDLTGARHDAKIGICYHIHDDRILYGIINCDGIYIVPPMYDYLKIIEEEEDSQRKHEPKVTIFGISGETKMGVERGVNKYIHSGGQYGLLSLDNKVIIPSLYDGISVYGNYVRTRKGNRFGLCNINGDVLLDVIYTAINFVEVNHKTQVVVFNIGGDFEGDINETDKYYSFGIKGFRTTPFSSSWHPRWEDIHMKITGGMWGYYNLVTKKKSERMYSEVSPFTKGYTCVKFDDKFYLLDLDFQVVDGPFPTKSAAVSYLDDYR